jgi:hypothetical protein
MGHRKNAERNLANAEKGYSDMSRFFAQATGITAEMEEEIQAKFKLVRDRLDCLQCTASILGTDHQTHTTEVEAASLFDAADKAIR